MVAKPRSNHCWYVAFRRADQPSKSITQRDCAVLLDKTFKHRKMQSSIFGKAQTKMPQMVSKLLVAERRSLAAEFTNCAHAMTT